MCSGETAVASQEAKASSYTQDSGTRDPQRQAVLAVGRQYRTPGHLSHNLQMSAVRVAANVKEKKHKKYKRKFLNKADIIYRLHIT